MLPYRVDPEQARGFWLSKKRKSEDGMRLPRRSPRKRGAPAEGSSPAEPPVAPPEAIPEAPRKKIRTDPLGTRAHDERYRGGSEYADSCYNPLNQTGRAGPTIQPKVAFDRARKAVNTFWADYRKWEASRFLDPKGLRYGFRCFDIHKLNEYDGSPVSVDLEESRRHAIRFLFEKVHGAPPEAEWAGRGGTISRIRLALMIPDGSVQQVRDVMTEAKACLEEERAFGAKEKKAEQS